MINQRNLDNLFTNLKILSRVHRYERISTRSSIIRIETSNILQSINRWWYSENRCKNIDIIECLLNEAFDYITQLIKSYKTKKRVNVWKLLSKINKELSEVLKGLKNLRCTYETDSVIIARIDVLLEKIAEYSSDIMATQPNNLP
jgi:hypothetical protein